MVEQPASGDLHARYDYESQEKSLLDEPTTLPADELRASAMQWPQSPQEQMAAMADRLERVIEAVNQAANSHYVVRFGRAKCGAAANGDGSVTVDTMMLWRLNEESLAALIAHEAAHESLGHPAQFKRLEAEQGQPGYAQRVGAIELAADQMAGRLLARTSYGLSGVQELLRQVYSSRSEPEAIEKCYPRTQRWVAYEQGFNHERLRPSQMTATTRPSETASSRRARRS